VVRRHAFHYRYDTAVELQLLNELYPLVRVRLNMFTATTKAIDWRSNKHGKKTRVYDKPRTQYQRVLNSGILTPERVTELAQLFDETNPAELTRQITTIQTRLIALAKDKTDAVTADVSRAKPDEARTHISRASWHEHSGAASRRVVDREDLAGCAFVGGPVLAAAPGKGGQ
jgi:hypothetical protein